MKISFTKCHANGNDFIIVFSADLQKNILSKDTISFLCTRHTGIGADGLFVISPSEKYDFFLDYYKASVK